MFKKFIRWILRKEKYNNLSFHFGNISIFSQNRIEVWCTDDIMYSSFYFLRFLYDGIQNCFDFSYGKIWTLHGKVLDVYI